MSIVDLAIGFVVGFFAFPFLLILLARMAPNDDEFIKNHRAYRARE